MSRDKFYWLNEASVKMLDDKYLVGDTTPKERVRQISDRA